MKTESKSTSNDTSTHDDQSITFDYPVGGKVVTIKHSDGTSVTRLLGLINGSLLGIDIERMPIIDNAEKEIFRLSSIDRITVEQEKIPPTEITVGGLTGWRYVYRLYEGGKDHGYLETIMVDTPKGVYRIKMNVPVDSYNHAKRILNTVISSLFFK